jgi:glucose-6-phosphate 1-dehydrogenase
MTHLHRPPDQDIVIIGATGNLSRNKLLPALYNLFLQNLLPKSGKIIGYARTPLDNEGFRSLVADAVRESSPTPLDEGEWVAFASMLHFTPARDGLEGVKALCGKPNRLIYLSIPPSAFASTVKAISAADLVDGTRLIIEKPFGDDLASSRDLDRVIHESFSESQVFRIDHYLGKETVQNILVFRFGNSVFEKVWNRDSIDHVQFTVAESIGIEGRGAFYEETGAMRDILQNHVLQVLAMLTMEAPSAFKAETIRDEKAKLFDAMRPLSPEDVVLGQYTAGTLDGGAVPGYRSEPGVAPESDVETFAAARMFIDNWRWAGVPFYVRTGKRLPRRTTEALVVFREAPVMLFNGTPVERLKPNSLGISIQPEEEIRFQFLAKIPGSEIHVEPVEMHFGYREAFEQASAPAYERLLHDAFCGDTTLFQRDDTVERSWEVLEPVLKRRPQVCPYEAGTWGPTTARTLIEPRLWHPR